MKKFIIGLSLIASASSASAYTCVCLGTKIKQAGHHTEYSGYCHIHHISQLVSHGEKFKGVKFNNSGHYQASKDLSNFITSISLMNDLNESTKKVASIYDQSTGFICTGTPALQLPADFYTTVIPLFEHKELEHPTNNTQK